MKAIKAKSVTVKRLRKWSEIEDYRERGWLYRGQKDASWDLVTSLERACNRLGVVNSHRPEAEERLLRQFKRAYHEYASHIPEKTAALEWLSIMQHYGAPTRLLDFTYSIYIAAYFAVEAAENDCAVWAINGPWALEASKKCFSTAGKASPRLKRLGKPFMEGDEQIVHELCQTKPFARAALPSTPFRLNERLRIQQGTFLVPGDITHSFMSNLHALRGVNDPKNVVKIILPKSERLLGLAALWSMGISRSVLFPGMDGYAQSLGVYHSLFRPAPYGKESTPLIKI